MHRLWELSTANLILHSVVTISFYFIIHILKNKPIDNKIKIHIAGIMIMIEYLILFYILYNKLTVLYWFMLLLTLIPIATLTYCIIARYMAIVLIVTFFLSTFIMPKKDYMTKNAFELTAIIIFILNLLFVYFIFITYRILLQDSEKKNKLLFSVAYHDILTKLPNRQFIYKEIRDLIDKGQSFYLVYFNINNFKLINDSINYEVGDQLLIEVSKIIAANVKKNNVVARTNGDEFVCIYKNQFSKQKMQAKIEKILKDLSQQFTINDYNININLSTSVAQYPNDGNDSKELLKAIDLAFYHSRQIGKNKIVFYNKEIGRETRNKLIFEEKLNKALNNKEFYLMFQPIINIESAPQVAYFEALLRWNNQDLGQIPPLEFIPVAEQLGIIHDIGLWVLNETCKMILRLNREFPQKKYKISINVSDLQLKHKNFINNITTIINKHNINPEKIIIELTESVFIDDSIVTQQSIKELKEIGIKTAIDDFGTGYSSFSYLMNLDVDILKIDKSFINNMLNSDKKTKVVQSIVDLGHTMDMTITAEGVENKEQVEYLSSIHCNYIQGYYYSKPLKAEDLMEYLKK